MAAAPKTENKTMIQARMGDDNTPIENVVPLLLRLV